MSYQVLARKWRPRVFSEMVGQEHVLRALINALDNERLHHAYLFTGTRGVGKTTIARILAKCLNCERGVSSTPCGECSACTSIAEGRFVDLIEVDAASRTKVEDTRELLENVQYAPTVGRFKVYLIDEVHMLSSHSFNALLKTLEEPPPHVKFLLATTDPQKLPVTILSRCLQFNLKNLSPERIVEHLQHVLTEEQVPNEESGLWALARAADGSMRDALSLTDQAIAHGGGKLTEAEVSTMLGTIDLTAIADIARALVNNDGTEVLAVVQKMSEHAPDYSAALSDLLSVWHRVAIAQTVPDALDNRHGDYQLIQELAKALSREDVQLYYQIVLLGRRDLPLAPDPRIGFEMVMLRMLAFQPVRESRIDPPVNIDKAADAVVSEEAEAPIKKPETARADATTTVESTGSHILCEDALTTRLAASETEDTVSPSVERSNIEPTDTRFSDTQKPTLSDEPPSIYTDEDYPELSETEATRSSELMSTPPERATLSNASALNTSLKNEVENPLNPGELVDVNNTHPMSSETLREMSRQAHSLNSKASNELSGQRDATAKIEHAAKPVSQSDIDESCGAKAIANSQLTSGTENSSGSNKLMLDEVEPSRWIELYQGLSVGGVLQNIAANLALVEVSGNMFRFQLDINNSSLYEEHHRQRFADVLSTYFGQPVNVDIEVGPVVSETPQAYRLRINEERQQAALDSLKHDPGVRRIMDVFGGVLLEKTVKPID